MRDPVLYLLVCPYNLHFRHQLLFLALAHGHQTGKAVIPRFAIAPSENGAAKI
jgi:hypothetical protein